MDSTDIDTTRAKARRAYELGRLELGARASVLVVPMVALSLVGCKQPAVSLGAGLALLALAVGFRWWGRAIGRAVTPGLLAGSVPLVLPLVLRTSGSCCFGGTCWSLCMLGCVAGGVVAGAAVGVASAAEKEQRWLFLSAATLLAAVAGVLGCALVGAAGIAGMALAVVVSSLPIAVAAQRRAAV